MKLRVATPDDMEAVYKLICGLEEKILDKEGFSAVYQYNIGSPNNCYVVAEEEGRIIGFLSCQGQMLLHHAGWVYELQELFVEEEGRSKGVGKLLLDELENWLAGREYDVLEVSSNVIRRRAHRFYLQNGFGQTHLKFTKKKEY